MKTARAPRLVALVLAFSLFSSSILAPRRAEAGWGLLFAAVSGTSMGVNLGSVIFFSGSIGGVLTGLHLSKKAAKASTAKAVAFYLVAGIAAIGALYLLDGESGAGTSSSNFATMSDEAGTKLGITESEQQAFNAELPLINAVKEEVLLRAERDLSGVDPATVDAVRLAEVIRQHWLNLAPTALTIEAISAVEKIGRGF